MGHTSPSVYDLSPNRLKLGKWGCFGVLSTNTRKCPKVSISASKCPQKANNCCHNVTVAQDTWFQNSNISAETVILLTYCFACNFDFKQTMRECSYGEKKVSLETIGDRFNFCRETCMIALDNSFVEEGQIGGEGVVVERRM
ncbi:hypothetical protein NQ318_001545 [Aromia moschata]|uniref:Uncharacterized protein n=1 Tax=Aromia moschata TaxID=1265417 RepID=A0AAV8YB74_9CUCU|nr:hypothetical protein NQ318_001545 [Aromia moschata]